MVSAVMAGMTLHYRSRYRRAAASTTPVTAATSSRRSRQKPRKQHSASKGAAPPLAVQNSGLSVVYDPSVAVQFYNEAGAPIQSQTNCSEETPHCTAV